MILIRFKELSSDALKSRDTQLRQYLSYNLSVEIYFIEIGLLNFCTLAVMLA